MPNARMSDGLARPAVGFAAPKKSSRYENTRCPLFLSSATTGLIAFVKNHEALVSPQFMHNGGKILPPTWNASRSLSDARERRW